MIKYASQSGHPTYGLNHYVVDTESDVAKLSTKRCEMGSTAKVVATGNVYMLNSSKQWVLQPRTSSGGGTASSDGESDITILNDQPSSQNDSIIIL